MFQESAKGLDDVRSRDASSVWKHDITRTGKCLVCGWMPENEDGEPAVFLAEAVSKQYLSHVHA